MLAPKATLTALIAALAMGASSVSAALTKFDADYDGHTVHYKTSLGEMGKFVEVQNDAWLSDVFKKTNTKLSTAMDNGDISMKLYNTEIGVFYDTANTKYSNFAVAVSDHLRENPFNMLDFNEYAPEAWSDYMCDTLKATAEEMKLSDYVTKIAALQKAVEADIKAKAGKDVIEAKFKELYIEVSDEFATAFDNKRREFAEKFEKEDANTLVEKPAVTTTAPPTTDASKTTVPPTSADSSASSDNSTAPASGSDKNASSPTDASKSSASSAGLLAGVATVVVATISVALSI